MQVRSLVTAAALVAGLAAFAAPLPPSVTQRFKVTETNHQVVDLSAIGQPEQTTHIVTSYWISVTSTDSLRAREIGHPAFAFCACSSNVAWSTPGTRARSVMWLPMTVQPDSRLSAVTSTVTSTRSGSKPDFESSLLTAIE